MSYSIHDMITAHRREMETAVHDYYLELDALAKAFRDLSVDLDEEVISGSESAVPVRRASARLDMEFGFLQERVETVRALADNVEQAHLAHLQAVEGVLKA